ncbi:thioester domain-containing protein [Labedaea rhizosphaerae]|uniref:thioester domain-containing protein n=1 Tax=Labedaea rhizosphaerae TaxID=598644 RepID=UPI001414CC58|nr:thioester domain-containing protein [Labedaea rhizosphaerae]
MGAAVLTGSVALLVAALPAYADTPAHGTYQPGGEDGYSVKMQGENEALQTSLIKLKLDDGTVLQTYCVQIDVNLDRQHGMTEKPWDSYPDKNLPFNQNRAKINWVLHNSYPAAHNGDLAAIAGDTAIQFHDGLDAREAITATQAAIWHFSDGKDMVAPNQGDADDQADIVALYQYLTGPKNVGIEENENPSLALTPDSIKGKSGDKLGPFTIKTNGTIKELTSELPEGVKITDADGKAIASGTLKNGSKVYLSVPADAAAGSATLTVKANAHFDTGRLFVGDNYAEKPSQTLIVATGTDTELEASANASWTVAPKTTTTTPPAPQGSNGGGLANTGASIFVPVLVGVVLVGAGVGALLFQRRRRA